MRPGRRLPSRILSLLLAVLAVVGAVVHHLTADARAVLVVASFGFLLCLLAVPALALAVRGRSVFGVLLSVVVLVVAVAQYAPLFQADQDSAGGRQVRVLAQNLEFGQGDAGAVVATVRDHRVDVLAAVEITPEAVEALHRAGLRDDLPHEGVSARPGAAGLAVFSRCPVTSVDRRPGFDLGVLTASVNCPEGAYTAVVAHPVSPVYRDAPPAREASELRELLAGLSGDRPVVVAGDINATWDHVRLRFLREIGYVDSVDGGGDGYVPTWPSNSPIPPLLPIDHVLVRGAAGIGDTRSVTIPGTDHRGLLATVALPGPRSH